LSRQGTVTDFLARREHFAVVGSTNDVVRGWLAEGTPEVCMAVADAQSAGRGRDGRTWVAPAGGALLLSLGFRPTWLPPPLAWRLAAVVSLAMAEAAESATGLATGSIRLKWPNDLAIETTAGVRKLAGVLGESDGLGSDDPRVVIGIGLNGDWPSSDFPPELAASMTSLRALTDGRPVDHDALLETFLVRVEIAIDALRRDEFDIATWSDRQVTTGRQIELVAADGAVTTVQGLGVDPLTGALSVADDDATDGRRPIVVGEIRHVRLPAAARAVV
jgi:BirA family transcriptional regulator, biotin operon repressor / biotin---[acetyl-CoA-carboxylase] ligase